MVVTLPLGNGVVLGIAVTGAWPAALGVWAVNKLLRDPLGKIGSVNYDIKGSWSEPNVDLVSLSDANAAQRKVNEGKSQDKGSDKTAEPEPAAKPVD